MAQRKYSSAAVGDHRVCEPLPHSGRSVPRDSPRPDTPPQRPPGCPIGLSSRAPASQRPSAAPPGVHGGKWPGFQSLALGTGREQVPRECSPRRGQGSPNSTQGASQDSSQAALQTPSATFETEFNEHSTFLCKCTFAFHKRVPWERVPEPPGGHLLFQLSHCRKCSASPLPTPKSTSVSPVF